MNYEVELQEVELQQVELQDVELQDEELQEVYIKVSRSKIISVRNTRVMILRGGFP